MLSTAVSRNEDEACLLLHTILKRISTQHYPNCKTCIVNSCVYFTFVIYLLAEETKIEAQMKSEEARAKWENSFNLIFVLPIVNVS